jgi:hypothetical protein
MDSQEKSKLAEWLDKIQRDSWQLELVVSAFSIFLVLGALDALGKIEVQERLLVSGMGANGSFINIAYGILLMATLFVLINLIIHVVLRGLWISAVGLRSVSGEIDFERLRLSHRFDKFLRQKTGSFDAYIERLENLSSIAFSFTFLVVFVIISVGIWGLLIGLVTHFGYEYFPMPYSQIIIIVTHVLLSLFGMIYMLDFITLGWIKRIKWFSKFYYPVYRFYSIITLSALYRPIYYNLIDNKLGRKLGYLLIPYIVVTLWLVSLEVDSHIWYTETNKNLCLDKNHYDDLRREDKLIMGASIPSRFVSNGFLELFIRYVPNRDDRVLEWKCPEVEPPVAAGISSGFVIGDFGEYKSEIKFPEESLRCLSSLFILQINVSLFQYLQYRFFEHSNEGEKGLITMLDVSYLPRGQHEVIIKILGRDTVQDSGILIIRDVISFPFWKE